jgi:hypothetical protein
MLQTCTHSSADQHHLLLLLLQVPQEHQDPPAIQAHPVRVRIVLWQLPMSCICGQVCACDRRLVCACTQIL